MGKLMNIAEASRKLGVTTQTMRTWISNGYINVKLVGGSRFIDEATVVALQDTAKDTERSISELKVLREDNKREISAIRDGMDSRHYLDLTIRLDLRRKFLERVTDMMAYVGIITQREAVILSRRLQGESSDEIAEDFLLTRERIRQIVEKAIRKSGELQPFFDAVKKTEALENTIAELREEVNTLREGLAVYEGGGDEKEDNETRRLFEVFNTEIGDTKFSVRTKNVLRNPVMTGKTIKRIFTIGDLCRVQKTDILKRRNAGRRVMQEIEDFFEKNNLSWGMDVDTIYRKAAVLGLYNHNKS